MGSLGRASVSPSASDCAASFASTLASRDFIRCSSCSTPCRKAFVGECWRYAKVDLVRSGQFGRLCFGRPVGNIGGIQGKLTGETPRSGQGVPASPNEDQENGTTPQMQEAKQTEEKSLRAHLQPIPRLVEKLFWSRQNRSGITKLPLL